MNIALSTKLSGYFGSLKANFRARPRYFVQIPRVAEFQRLSPEHYERTAKLLLDKGADVNTLLGQYGGAIQTDSLEGHEEIVKLLLDNGSDIGALGGWNGSALQAASVDGHEQIVKLLLGRGADVNALGECCSSALQVASVEATSRLCSYCLTGALMSTCSDTPQTTALQLQATSGL